MCIRISHRSALKNDVCMAVIGQTRSQKARVLGVDSQYMDPLTGRNH